MGDELMPLAPLEEDDEMEDLPPLENEDEEFHSLIEDALLEEQSGTSESSFEEMDTREASLMLASPEKEKEKPKDVITPQKPPVEFERFAMVKPGPSVESPICAKPKPFVLQPAKPLGPTGTKPKPTCPPATRMLVAEAAEELLNSLKTPTLKEIFGGRKSTRSNTKIEGDPTREYLPIRASKKK